MPQQEHKISLVVGGVPHLSLDPGQFVGSQVEGNPNNRYAVRASPLVFSAGEIVFWPVLDFFGSEFGIELINTATQQRLGKVERQVANARVQELVSFSFPIVAILPPGTHLSSIWDTCGTPMN